MFFIALLIGIAFCDVFEATIYKNGDQFTIQKGVYDCDNGLVCARFFKEIESDGWDKINITSNSNHGKNSDSDLAHAAGMAEGFLCVEEIYYIFTNHNNYWGWANKSVPTQIMTFMQNNLDWTRKQVEENPKDAYWIQVGLIVSQFDGMLAGIHSVCSGDQCLDETQLFFLQSAGDLYGVVSKFPEEEVSFDDDFMEWKGMSCSGLVQAVQSKDGVEDVYIAQDTWRSFGLQNKFMKIYNFDYTGVAASSIVFSSSPGFISSKDDYYQTNAGLVILETTNSVYNEDLIEQITYESLFTWIRSPLCARMSTSGKEWVDYFSKNPSATYTNQWMIVDWKQFDTSKKVLDEGFLVVAEEIPTLVMSGDMTDFLIKNDYWPSYNIPYFPEIYNMSGYLKQLGPNGYEDAPRAKLFKELTPTIKNFSDFQLVMRYNHYKSDPIAQGDPANGIMSRYDLETKSPKAFGGIDSKLTYSKLNADLGQIIQAGPTHDSAETPAFEWTDQFKSTIHLGQPSKYEFDWIHFDMNYEQ